MNIVSYTSVDDFKFFKKEKEYTGQELFSLIVPSKINLTKGNLEIDNGTMKKGLLTNDFLGPKKKGALHQLIWDEYGVDETKRFLDDTNRMFNNFNLFNGFTVGIGDIEVPIDVEKQIHNIFNTKDVKVTNLITEIENNPELMDEGLYEDSIFSDYNVIREDVSKLIVNNLPSTNNFKVMMDCGSKGAEKNIGQIGGCMGLQAVGGKMIPKSLNRRTLPYFFQNDDRGESRGLIKSSLLNGMTYTEYFYQHISGREGCIDTAVKTAQSGYIQRKLIKLLEDFMLKYDGTVRSATNSVIQFVYGDTGADTTKQFEFAMKIMEMGDTEMSKKYKIKDEDLTKYEISKEENEKYFEELKAMRDKLRYTQIKTKMDYISVQQNFFLPINITRIVENIKNNNTLKEVKDSKKLTAKYIIQRLQDTLKNENTKLMCIPEKDRNNVNSVKYQDEQTAKTTFKIALHSMLAPAKCFYEYNYNKAQFDDAINQIIENYNRNLAEPGEMIGTISGQAMGEPVTQLTLHSIHSAGIKALAKTTQGVPRIQELLSLSKNLKTPQMIIYLSNEYMGSREMANKVASNLKYTTLGHLRNNIEVYYEPNAYKKGGHMDKDNVNHIYYSHNPSKYACQSDINNLPWLIRIELDREKMLEKEVTLLEIKSKFCNSWERRYTDMKNMKREERNVMENISQLAILSNSDNDEQPVIHIRFEMIEYEVNMINNFIDYVIDTFMLKGIASIEDLVPPMEVRALSFDNPDHTKEVIKQFVIYTSGSDLYEIRYLKGIDLNKTICNDVVAIYETFGIEAARSTLVREISIAFERGGTFVNYHHLSVLADMMTFGGYLTSIDRHGMGKSDTDPLSRASFEKTVDQLLQAAVFGEVDHMKGVSSRIMAGLVIKGGTGLCDIVLNSDMIEKSEFTEDIGQKYQKTFVPIQKSNVNDHIVKEKEETGFFVPE